VITAAVLKSPSTAAPATTINTSETTYEAGRIAIIDKT